MFIDSHCHLNYLHSADKALERARSSGVEGILCIGVDESGIDDVLAIAQAHSDVWASVGMHPQSAQQNYAWIEEKLSAPSVVAVGETGLDYKTAMDEEEQRLQLNAFEYQMDLADRHGLPVVIHTRDAEHDTLKMLENFPNVTGVLHCFTESWEMAEHAMALGYFISISGIVTFAKAENVRAVAAKIPLDRLLIETDAPWLAPVPHRGKENEPAYVSDTAYFLAELRSLDISVLASATSANFSRLFLA
jgi:TatD DNase family protein